MSDVRISGYEIVAAVAALRASAAMLQDLAAGMSHSRRAELYSQAARNEFRADDLERPFRRQSVTVVAAPELAEVAP